MEFYSCSYDTAVASSFAHMMRSKIAFLAAVLVLYGVYVMSTVNHNLVTTTANIVDVQYAFNELMQMFEARVTVDYSIDDTSYTTSIRTTTTSVPFKGDSMTVIYDPATPELVTEEPEIPSEIISWICVLAGLIVLLNLL